jgi:hypothetical protein
MLATSDISTPAGNATKMTEAPLDNNVASKEQNMAAVQPADEPHANDNNEALPAAPPLASPSVQSTIFDDDEFEIGDSYDEEEDDDAEAGQFVGGRGGPAARGGLLTFFF